MALLREGLERGRVAWMAKAAVGVNRISQFPDSEPRMPGTTSRTLPGGSMPLPFGAATAVTAGAAFLLAAAASRITLPRDIT
jgi:hypothetical protein